MLIKVGNRDTKNNKNNTNNNNIHLLSDREFKNVENNARRRRQKVGNKQDDNNGITLDSCELCSQNNLYRVVTVLSAKPNNNNCSFLPNAQSKHYLLSLFSID